MTSSTDTSNDDCPVSTEALSSTRYTVQLFGDGSIDLNVSRIGSEQQTNSTWTGKTYFLMRGAGGADLDIEAKEIRENLTDFDYAGNEQIGNENGTLINNSSFEGIFLEDNQATIRILESGRSPAFRHTEKTQRVNLAWLAKPHSCVHRTSSCRYSYKAFHQVLKSGKGGAKTHEHRQQNGSLRCAGCCAATPGEIRGQEHGGNPNRILVEVCCSHESKLGDTSRRPAAGCHVIRITQDDDILSHATRKRVIDEEKSVRTMGNKATIPVSIWASVPCTGGTAWSHINMNHDTAKEKVKRHRSICNRIWSAFVDLVNSMEFAKPLIAIEWPRSCTYWNETAVDKFVRTT